MTERGIRKAGPAGGAGPAGETGSGAGSLTGRLCLVTGASAGIGLQTALGLARLGARLILVCRDPDRGEAARRVVQRAARAAVELRVADLASQRAVAALARGVALAHPRLHVLVHNAAILPEERRLSPDGIELQLAVNHLAPFLLTRLLLPLLRAGAPSRVVVVASQVEAEGRIDLDDLGARRGYTRLGAYRQSKLANVLFTYELARRLAGSGVTANCLHPGVINTGLLSDFKGQRRALGWLRGLRHHPGPAAGARTSLRLAADPALASVSGRYFRPEGEARSSPASHDAELGRRLWAASEALILPGLVDYDGGDGGDGGGAG